jgi:hypothetical protein
MTRDYSFMGGVWPDHHHGCPVHDSFIVMSGMRVRRQAASCAGRA